MPDLSILIVFIPTFLFISITPGMCMSLALTLGMVLGIKKTLWMMLGEVIGVGLVAILSVLGVAKVMIQYPSLFAVFKWAGGIYLVYLGIKTWRTKVHIFTASNTHVVAPKYYSLISQGFLTAVANPKGWAFMISLLPPFINIEKSLPLQLTILVTIIMCSEFVCMLIYALGGKSLTRLVNKGDKAQWVNIIGGLLLMCVGLWLALG